MDRIPVIAELLRWTLFYFALVATFWALDARALDCEPCHGWDRDIAIDADEILVCTKSDPGPAATYVEWETHYSNNVTVTRQASMRCVITAPIFSTTRAQFRVRFCNETECSEWSPWSAWVRQLEPFCPADLDGDGAVDGTDFLLFRTAFIHGCEATP